MPLPYSICLLPIVALPGFTAVHWWILPTSGYGDELWGRSVEREDWGDSSAGTIPSTHVTGRHGVLSVTLNWGWGSQPASQPY